MKKLTSSFGTGAIALVFAILGYQTALLIHHSATAQIIANRDEPDTVFVCETAAATYAGSSRYASCRDDAKHEAGARHYAKHSPKAQQVRRKAAPRHVENFRFDPNTCTHEDFMRLGFSSKQAESIINYRNKGGRFRRKTDFAKSYVVSDSIYARLEPYIDIPKIDINLADSATFDLLPGIGGWYAKKMVEHRARLGGYSFIGQLMDIKGIDEEKFEGFSDLVCISAPYKYPLWDLSADSLARHPYIKSAEIARRIVFYRDHNPQEQWTVDGLRRAGIINSDTADKLTLAVTHTE